MNNTQELIVRFQKGTSEDDARKIAESAGTKVRRRMRGDSPDEVTLLLRVEGDVKATEKQLKGHKSVDLTEINHGGFRPMDGSSD